MSAHSLLLSDNSTPTSTCIFSIFPSLSLSFFLLPWCFPGGSESKESAFNAGDLGSTSGSGRFPEEGNGYSLQYSHLKKSTDREARWATAHGVAKSRTRLSDEHLHSMPPALGVDYASCSVSGSISTCTPLAPACLRIMVLFFKRQQSACERSI